MTTDPGSDPSTYGRSFADVYDDWYASSFDTDGAVAALRRLAGNGPVLELGVGTGRLALPLAAFGLHVVGLDASEEMLTHLRAADPNETVLPLCGDMAKVSATLEAATISEEFSLVFCAFNTLLNLPDIDAIVDCLRESREHLRADGLVVIEAVVPIDHSEIPLRSLTPARVDSDAAVFIETTFDASTSRLHGRHIEVRANSVVTRPWSVLLCGPDLLDSAAQSAGLVLVERWNDWSGAAFREESTAHISIYAPTERFS